MTGAGRSGVNRYIRSRHSGSKRSSPFRNLLSWFLPFGDLSSIATPSVAAFNADPSRGTASATARGSGISALLSTSPAKSKTLNSDCPQYTIRSERMCYRFLRKKGKKVGQWLSDV